MLTNNVRTTPIPPHTYASFSDKYSAPNVNSPFLKPNILEGLLLTKIQIFGFSNLVEIQIRHLEENKLWADVNVKVQKFRKQRIGRLIKEI